MLSTGGNGGLPGHFTSQHAEGAATLCAEPRPMAKTFSQEERNVTYFSNDGHSQGQLYGTGTVFTRKTYHRSLAARVAALAQETA